MDELSEIKKEKERLAELSKSITRKAKEKGSLLVKNEQERKKVRSYFIISLAIAFGSYTANQQLVDLNGQNGEFWKWKVFQLSLALGIFFASISMGILSSTGPSNIKKLSLWIKRMTSLFFLSSFTSVILLMIALLVLSPNKIFSFWAWIVTFFSIAFFSMLALVSIKPVYLLIGPWSQLGTGFFWGAIVSIIFRTRTGAIMEGAPILAWVFIISLAIILLISFYIEVNPKTRKMNDGLNLVQRSSIFLIDPDRALKSFATVNETTKAKIKALKIKLDLEKKQKHQVAYLLAKEIIKDYEQNNPITSKILKFIPIIIALFASPIWEALIQESLLNSCKKILCKWLGFYC